MKDRVDMMWWILVLLLATITPGAVVYGLDSDAAAPVIELVPIVISAKRTETDIQEMAEYMTIVTAEELQKLPARDLGDVLTYIPGIDVNVGHQLGQASSVSIQGAESRHVLVMIDDIPFNTQLSGQANPTKIPIESIERIEIIKGGASSAWGSSLGGVINVVTKIPVASHVPQGEVSASHGGFQTRRQSFAWESPVGKGGYLLSGSLFRSDGFLSEDGVEEDKWLTKLSYPIDEHLRLSGLFGYTGSKTSHGVLSNGRVTTAPTYTRYGKVEMEMQQPDMTLKTSLKYNEQDIGGETVDTRSGTLVSSSTSGNRYRGVSTLGQWSFREEDLLAVGSDFEWHTIKSNNYLDSSQSVTNQAPFLNYTYRIDPWDIIPGVRLDHNSRFGHEWSPSLGAVYHQSPALRFRGKASRIFNAPPLLWIVNDDPALMVGPNFDLEPETATSYEAGTVYQRNRLTWELGGYWVDVKDAIATVFDSAQGVFRKQNFRKFRRQGGEMTVRYQLTDTFSCYTGGGFHHVVNRTTDQVVRDNGTARQSFQWGAQYQNPMGLQCHLYGYYKRWDSSPALEPNDRKPIFDLRITQSLSPIISKADAEVFFNVGNLTNSKYWANKNFPLPERYFEGGMALRF
jgi:vitamin B12 transporter